VTDDDGRAEAGSGQGVDGFEELQRAALEAVRAARAVLDAAESIVRDPAALESIVHSVTSVARSAGEVVIGFASGAAHAAGSDGAPPTGRDRDDGPDGGFERIRVD
jgi:cytochrome c5